MIKSVKINKRGKSYQLYYYNSRGERRRITAGSSFEQARRFAVRFTDLLMEGKDPEREILKARESELAREITLAELFHKFMEEHGNFQSNKMIKFYHERFNNIKRCPALANISIDTVSRRIVHEYMIERKKQDRVSNSTVNREVTVIRTMLNKAVDWEIIEKNPLEKFKLLPEPPKREVDLTVEEASELIKELTLSFAMVVMFAIYTGFRRDNILGLTIGQVKFHDIGDTGEVRLLVKGGKYQVFPLGPNAVEVLKQEIGERMEGFVFINPRTGTRYRSVSDSFRRAVRRLNLKVGDSPLTFHDLRHVFATWLHRQGVSLDMLRILLGHNDRSTTDRYTTANTTGAGKLLSLMPRIESPSSRKAGAI